MQLRWYRNSVAPTCTTRAGGSASGSRWVSGAEVPVYATRGRGGGFQLVEGYHTDLAGPDQWSPTRRRPGRSRRAAVRISPEGRRLAAVLGRLQPIRVRRAVPPDDYGWVEATFRLESIDGAALEGLPRDPQSN